MKMSVLCLFLKFILGTDAAWAAARLKASFLSPGTDPMKAVESVDELHMETIHDELKETAPLPGQAVMTAAMYKDVVRPLLLNGWSPYGVTGSFGGPSPAPAPAPAPGPWGLASVAASPSPTGPSYSIPGAGMAGTGIHAAMPPGLMTIHPHAYVEMDSSDPHLVEASSSDASGVALTIASGLAVTADVPLTRFVVMLPDMARATVPNSVLRCESSMSQNMRGAYVARYASKDNSTFSCMSVIHQLNATSLPFSEGLESAFLQKQEQRRAEALAQEAAPRLQLEAAIFPATGVDGDTEPAETVADDIVQASGGSEEPQRVLLADGNWTYKASSTLKWRALFPGARASHLGKPFDAAQENSIELGPNPGAFGVKLGPGNVTNATEEEQLAQAEENYHEADTINLSVEHSLTELSRELAAASKAHMEVLTNSSFVLYDPYDMGSKRTSNSL